MTMTESELRELKESTEHEIQLVETSIETRIESGRTIAPSYDSLKNNSLAIAGATLRLRDSVESRGWYAKAGLYSLAFMQQSIADWQEIGKGYKRTSSRIFLRGLQSAVVSGNQRLIRTFATRILEFDEKYEQYIGDEDYWDNWKENFFEGCLICCLVCDEESSEEYLTQYYEIANETKTDLTEVYEGVTENSESKIKTAIESRLRSHETSDEIYPWEGVVCLPAAAYLLIARSHGMDIRAAEFDSEYLPDALDEYDIGDDLELPHPEYVDADLIPDA